MPDLCHSGKLPPKDVVGIHKHIGVVCEDFVEWSDVEFADWAMSVVVASGKVDTGLALLASIGVDLVVHIRAGGGFILTEPPAAETER